MPLISSTSLRRMAKPSSAALRATRTKAPSPPLRAIPADYAPMDCLIGEKQFRGRNLDGFR